MAHPITDALANVSDPAERHRVKAEAFAALSGWVGKSVTRGQYTLTLTSAAVVPAHRLLEFSVKIVRAGKDVTPPDLNPIRVWNPPILVDDPAGDIVRTSTDPVTGAVKETRYRENLPAAMLAIVRDLVR